MVQKKEFREDLYYRPGILKLHLSLLLLARQMIKQYNKRLNTQITGISTQLEHILEAYDWPGSISSFYKTGKIPFLAFLERICPLIS